MIALNTDSRSAAASVMRRHLPLVNLLRTNRILNVHVDIVRDTCVPHTYCWSRAEQIWPTTGITCTATQSIYALAIHLLEKFCKYLIYLHILRNRFWLDPFMRFPVRRPKRTTASVKCNHIFIPTSSPPLVRHSSHRTSLKRR